MVRNLGGAIGTAAVETFFTKREQFHSFIINQHVSLLEPATRDRLGELQQYFMAATGLSIDFDGLEPLVGGAVLLLGCPVLLIENVRRSAGLR